MRCLLPILLLLLAGCQSLREIARMTLTPEEQREVVARARKLAVESGLLSDSEKAIVMAAQPKLSYYFMAGPGFAQYVIAWGLPQNDSITIYGEGNLLLLEGAQIVRKPNKYAGVGAGCPVLLALDSAWPRSTQCEGSLFHIGCARPALSDRCCSGAA